MSFYRRYPDGKTQRHIPETGEFVDCAPDEPETRKRGPGEGMIVAPAHMLKKVTLSQPVRLLSIKEIQAEMRSNAEAIGIETLTEGVDFAIPPEEDPKRIKFREFL